MLRKLLILVISAVLAALAAEASAARRSVSRDEWLPGAGLRYGWGAYGPGYYGFAVPYHRDYGHDYYGSAFPSDFVPRNPSECGDGCPVYSVTVRSVLVKRGDTGL
ncbi:MAG: hypothetical protein WAK01_07285 [Methylocystis sp.]